MIDIELSVGDPDEDIWIQGIWIDSHGQTYEETLAEAPLDAFIDNTLPHEIQVDGHTYKRID